MYTFEDIINCLAINPGGSGPWTCRCPTANHKNGDKNPSARLFIGNNGDLMFKCFRGCTTQEVAEAIGIPLKYWFKDNTSAGDYNYNPKDSVSYDYTDTDGNVLFTVVRYTNEKRFFQKRKVVDQDKVEHGVTFSLLEGWYKRSKNKKGVWEKIHNEEKDDLCLYLPAAQQVPFRLHKWYKNKAEPLFVVEGEKKVMALEKLDFVATCNSGGALKFGREHAEFVKDRRVIILPDNDLTGHRHAGSVAGWLAFLGCPQFTIVDLSKKFPAMEEKEDIYDLLQKYPNQTKNYLYELIEKGGQYEYKIGSI